MIAKFSVVASLGSLALPTVMQRPLLWSLVVLSLCVGLMRVGQPVLTPRLLTRLWRTLPPYTLLLRGGDTVLRCPVVAGSATELKVRLDAPLDIVLRPEQREAGPVFVHAFVRHAGQLSAWPILMEHSADGSLLLGGIVRDLLDLSPGARGRYELLFVVQRSPLPPSCAAVQTRLTSRSAEPQLLRGAVEILPPANP